MRDKAYQNWKEYFNVAVASHAIPRGERVLIISPYEKSSKKIQNKIRKFLKGIEKV